ncbi:unnamed protein product [Lota lota]
MARSKPEQLLARERSCPVCLQLFSDAVLLPCGHSCCLVCIGRTLAPGWAPGADRERAPGDPGWAPGADRERAPGVLRCPECREEFKGLESLRRNLELCGTVEGYRATAKQEQGPGDEEEQDVFSGACVEGGVRAVKSCPRCDAGLCERHLQRHQEKDSFRSHVLPEPQREPVPGACALHGSGPEYFCSSDAMLLCASCLLEGSHLNHDVLSFDAAEEEMRQALDARTKVMSCRLQTTESLLQKAAEEQGASEAMGEKLVSQAVTLMDNMAALVQRHRERLGALLEEERSLRRNSWQHGLLSLGLQQQHLLQAQGEATQALSETDKCLFVHRFLALEPQIRTALSGSAQLPSRAPLNHRRLQAGLRTQDFRGEMTCLLDSLHMVLNPLELTFNPHTAHPTLLMSNDLRTVRVSPARQPYGEHPERFSSAPQVLCSQGFSGGEHVWEVEVGEGSMWSLGLCYKSLPRRGAHSRLGHNDLSWRLQWKNRKLTARHASAVVALGERTDPPLRIELALDCRVGSLAFHSVKGQRQHLHTFRAAFREPVYPAFSLHSRTPESWITLQSGM